MSPVGVHEESTRDDDVFGSPIIEMLAVASPGLLFPM